MTTSNDKTVSVILPVYNGERFLREALDSVLGQTYRPIEVIVVDDGSTDESGEILKEYERRVRLIRQENAGVAAARNRGLAEARGGWIAFQDQDDVWDANKLEEQMNAARSEDAVVDCGMRVIDGTGRVVRERLRPARRGDPILVEWLEGCLMSITSTVVRRRALEEVGGFDAANRFGTDDYQLWLALAASGHRFRFMERVLASYRSHGRNFSENGLSMDMGDVYVLKWLLRNHPEALGPVELRACRRRLHDLHFEMGWLLYDPGRYVEAARHFRAAVRQESGHLKTWAYAIVTHVPFRNTVLARVRRAARSIRGKGRG